VFIRWRQISVGFLVARRVFLQRHINLGADLLGWHKRLELAAILIYLLTSRRIQASDELSLKRLG
jgi:hypothetical protein